MKKIKEIILFLIALYTFGLALFVIFKTLYFLGTIRIINAERLSKNIKRRILVANHPSVIDPFLIFCLGLQDLLCHPFSGRLMIMADKTMFYDKWYFAWARPVMIPVDRESKKGKLTSLLQAIRAIENGNTLAAFLEGGRTFKGEKSTMHKSPGGNYLRPLEGSAKLIAERTGAEIALVWIKGSDRVVPNSRKTLWTGFNWLRLFKKGITIKIGKPFDTSALSTESREIFVQRLAIALLAVADE